MTTPPVSVQPAKVLRLTAILSTVLGAMVLVGAIASGHTLIGITGCVGIALGCANGLAASRFFETGLPFGATSGIRLVALTFLVVFGSLVFGMDRIWPFVMGLGLSQLILAGTAAVVVAKA